MFVDYLLYGRFVDDDIAYHITCIDLNIQSDKLNHKIFALFRQ